MKKCLHMITRNHTCVACGETIFAFETRPCSECLQFKKSNTAIPICKKKNMVAPGDMHVYYKIKDGTCFEGGKYDRHDVGWPMNFNALPPDMQEDVKKLAREHPITQHEALEIYLMAGNEHSEYLCQLKSANAPDAFIAMENRRLWDERNKDIFNQLERAASRKRNKKQRKVAK